MFLAFSGLWRISDERLSELALIHLHHDLDIDEICTITRGGCSKGASCMSRIQIHSKGPRNNVQLWLLGGGCGGEVICHKKSSFFFSMATSDWTKKKTEMTLWKNFDHYSCYNLHAPIILEHVLWTKHTEGYPIRWSLLEDSLHPI